MCRSPQLDFCCCETNRCPILTEKQGKNIHQTPSNKENNPRDSKRKDIQQFCSGNCLNDKETVKKAANNLTDWAWVTLKMRK